MMAKKKIGRPAGPPRKTVSMRILTDLWEQAQELAYLERKTVTAEVERALAAWVAAGQKKHNGGKPFKIPPPV